MKNLKFLRLPKHDCQLLMALAICIACCSAAPECTSQERLPNDSESSSKIEVDPAVEKARKEFDETGDEKAARLILQKTYIGRKWAELNEEQRDDFGKLIEAVRKGSPDDVVIKQVHVDYLIASKRLEDALPVLDELAKVQPMRALQAAAILRQLGQEQKATDTAAKCLSIVKKLSSDKPENATITLAVAQTHLFLHQHTEAVKVLRDSSKDGKSNAEIRQLRNALGDTYVAWIAHEKKTTKASFEQTKKGWEMLVEGIRFAPNNPRVLGALVDEITSIAEEEVEELRSKKMEPVKSLPDGFSHFVQATVAVLNDDSDTTRQMINLAMKHMPGSLGLMNNLAVAVSIRDKIANAEQPAEEEANRENHEQGLKLANVVIEYSKDPNPAFHETRGQILYRLKRYEDAIPDLVKALESITPQPAARKALAHCRQMVDG